MLVHDSHVLLANTRDEEMTKSCGPCVALWLTVLGSIGIASTSGSVELQTCQAKIHIPATRIFALLPWEYAQRLYSRSAQSTVAERHLRIDVWTSQPKSCPIGRLAACKVDWLRTISSTGTVWLAGPCCILLYKC